MKIIMMGTGPFAVPTYRWLLESDHSVPLLVTRPIDDAGRRRKSAANPVRDLAVARGGPPVFDPHSINDRASIDILRREQADLMVVCDYGQILSRETLAATRFGGINLHGSLLPAYRGAAPIHWAIYNGEAVTGVTVIHMTPRLDGGPILVQQSMEIGERETAGELEPRMADAGVNLVSRAITMLAAWNGTGPIGMSQRSGSAAHAPRLRKEDGRIDWSRSARQLFNQIRAFQPWPGSYTHWMGDRGSMRMIVLRAEPFADSAAIEAPGRVQSITPSWIDVATGQGVLRLLELQPAGKRAMSAAEFLRGRSLAIGDLLGDFGQPG